MTKAPAVYWLAATGDDVPGDSEWLTGRELDKLEQLRFTKRRADWRLDDGLPSAPFARYREEPAKN